MGIDKRVGLLFVDMTKSSVFCWCWESRKTRRMKSKTSERTWTADRLDVVPHQRIWATWTNQTQKEDQKREKDRFSLRWFSHCSAGMCTVSKDLSSVSCGFPVDKPRKSERNQRQLENKTKLKIESQKFYFYRDDITSVSTNYHELAISTHFNISKNQ